MALIFTHLDALATFGSDCADLHQQMEPYLTGIESGSKGAS